MKRRHFLAGLTATSVGAAGGAAAADQITRFLPLHAGGGAASHEALDVLLARYVSPGSDGIDRVDYAGWKRSAADRHALEAYIDTLSAVEPTGLTKPEQFTFWTNLYNALTLRVVLAAYPVRSIRDIRPNLFAVGPWKERVVEVRGTPLSLDDIEHGILRAGWRDPRVHYAVNCASVSCPNLGRRAHRAETLSADLNAAARAYVNHHRGADVENGRLTVSSIYRWYEADFGGSDLGVMQHLRTYAAPPLAGRLAGITAISGDRYDWSLNERGAAK